MRIVVIAGLALLVAVCVVRGGDLLQAVAAVPPAALLGLAALHLLGLVARSEAWRLSLAAVAGAPLPRSAVHAANAGAFVAGSLEPHATIPARVALLRRLAPGAAPHPGHVAVADLPIFLIEVVVIAALLGLTGAWWAPPAALAALVAARLLAGRRATRGLAVLADVRRRAALAALVGCVVACGLARVWVVLAMAHLDASPAATAVAFATLGAFGLLPLGPSAPPGALLVVTGGAGALGAGLALSATSIAAVLVYAAALALLGNRAQPGLEPVELEGPEAVEHRVVGAVEVGRAGGEQPELGAGADDERGLVGVMGRVEGLDPVEPELGEAADRRGHAAGLGHVPEGVRPDRDPARIVDDLDRLGHGRRRARAVGRRPGHEIGLQQLRGVHDLLVGKAHPVRGMVERRLGKVRTTDRVALRQVELKAALPQRLRHADGAGGAVGTEGGQGAEERDGAVVDPVAQDVEVVELGVERRDLDGGREAEAQSRARLERLVDAVHRVMVGQRQQLDARIGRRRDHGTRR
jgi:hypothetical protein